VCTFFQSCVLIIYVSGLTILCVVNSNSHFVNFVSISIVYSMQVGQPTISGKDFVEEFKFKSSDFHLYKHSSRAASLKKEGLSSY
jgi:hypothetical protein